MADVSAPRPGSAAALRRARADALKKNLQTLSAQHSDVLEGLTPDVRMRVEALREIQTKHDGIEAEYLKERAAVEAKYQKMYEPLYSQRSDIVNGVNKEVEADDKDSEVEKGVPDFWLNAMKSNDVVAEEITEDDEGALMYLTDIKCCWIEEPKGFKLDFLFDTNPYFSNAVLSKTYHLTDDVETILEKVIGTEIGWKDGKRLTKKVCKTKRKKGSMDMSTTKTEHCKSFFNFFKPPHVPKPENYEDLDEKRAEELQNQMEQDYDIGSTIRDKIIPHAVSWFTGEAAQGEYCEYNDMDDEDNDEEDDDDEGGQESEEDYDETIKSRNNSPSFKDSEDELNEGDDKDSEEDEDVDETNKSRKKSRIMNDEDDDEDGDDTDEDGDD